MNLEDRGASRPGKGVFLVVNLLVVIEYVELGGLTHSRSQITLPSRVKDSFVVRMESLQPSGSAMRGATAVRCISIRVPFRRFHSFSRYIPKRDPPFPLPFRQE